MTKMNVLHQIQKMMQTIISQSPRNYCHDNFYVNLDMRKQLVNDSQFHHAINAKNANCLAINAKNANCHGHMFSGYAHNQ